MRRLSFIGSILLALALLLISTGAAAPPPIRVDVPPTTEATSVSATSVTYSVKAYDTTVNPNPPAIAATCTGGSGSGDFQVTAEFALGNNSAQCTASLGNGTAVREDFTVTVVDTTAPSFGSAPSVTEPTTDPTGKNVTYPTPTATDLGESLTVTCSPPSGSKFIIGTTQVGCSANDGRGNTGHVFFNVTVTLTDNQPPTFTNVPSSSTTEATGPGGAAVSWTIAATDNADPNPTINCNPASGSTFAIGTTAVQCRATDAAGNFTDAAPFNVTVQDTTPPTLTLPGNQNVETENAGGQAVTFSVTASDIVSGSIAPSCNHSSGETFPIGTTPVHCTATDGAGKSSSGDFNVTVALVDQTPPVLSGYGDKTVEANGPAGSVVNYSTPTAVDAQDGPIGAVPCSPASGATFPLGTTAVNCSATDAHGNTGRALFNVTVADMTGPNLIVPAGRSVYSTSPEGAARNSPGVAAFLGAASATDFVDPQPVVTNNAPDVLPVGTTDITFAARDASGNVTFSSSPIVVLPQPPPGTPPLVIPPAPTIPTEVTNVRVTPLDGAARIRWNAGGRKVMVNRSTSSARSLNATGDQRVVYTGTGSSYTDRGLTNGVEYRYLVQAVDAAGNRSAGVAAVIVPRRTLLKSPKDGARLKKAPKLLWALDAEAQYYNAQLLLNGKKILSVWPVSPAYLLKKSWTFEGRKYTLKPGVYTWFVWPGYGARSAVDYGELMGTRTFQLVR